METHKKIKNLYQKLIDSERKLEKIIADKIQANNSTHKYTIIETKKVLIG